METNILNLEYLVHISKRHSIDRDLIQSTALIVILIALDVKMPVLNGFELCKKIRELDKTVPVIFITALEGYYEQLRRESYSELNNDRNINFVKKPIANEALIILVNTIIAK